MRELAEKYDPDIFYTSPTSIRQFIKWGEEELAGYDFDFRELAVVGEPSGRTPRSNVY